MVKRLYALVMLAILPLVVALVVGAIDNYRMRSREAHDEVLRLATFAADELARIIDTGRSLVVALAKLPQTQGHDTQGCSAFAAALAKDYPQFDGFGAFDLQGRLFCSSNPATVLPADFHSAPFFTDAVSAGDFVIAPFLIGRTSKKPVLPLAMPVKDAKGHIVAVVAVGIDLSWLNAYFAAKPLPPQGVIGAIHRNGTVLLRVPALPDAIGRRVPESYRWLLTVDKPGATDGPSIDGVDRIFAYVPLGPSPNGLVMTVGAGRDAALAGVRAAALRDGLVVLGTVLLALVAAGLFGRLLVTRPVILLMKAIDRWRSGDTAARANVGGTTSEIAQIGAAFDAMADEIEHRQRDAAAGLEQKTLLVNELNHRVKNTLAAVQSIAFLSFRNAGSLGTARTQLTERLLALSRAHDALTRVAWGPIDLGDLIREAIAPFHGMSITLEGPEVGIRPTTALVLAMAVHELATNAVKYGALSIGAGRVSVRWFIEDGPALLRLRWAEKDGPIVTLPERRGFGSRLIEQQLAREFAGTVMLDFAPAGLICTMEIPIGAVVADLSTSPEFAPPKTA
jgi:two-component sensor histidine kinase